MITVLKVKRQLVWKGCSFFNYLNQSNFTFPEISIIDNHLVCLGALSRIMKSHKSKLSSTPQMNIKKVLYGWFYQNLAWLLPKTYSQRPVYCFVISFQFLMCSLKVQWTSFIQMVASVCVFLFPHHGQSTVRAWNLLIGANVNFHH